MPPTWTDADKTTHVVEFLDGMLGLNDEGDVTLGFGTEFDAGVATLTQLARPPAEVRRRAP